MINGFVFLKSTHKVAAIGANKVSPILGIEKLNDTILNLFAVHKNPSHLR
jgi:hypothetical protein